MFWYLRLVIVGFGVLDERFCYFLLNMVKIGGYGEEICCKGNGYVKVKKDVF